MTDRAGIADNFDAFLQMLTTQLQNQNPLDPLDTNQFTQQLVQFSGVEQSIKTNENLEALIQVSAANIATAATSFIGKKVMIQSTTTNLKDGAAEWSYAAGSGATNATFTVRDEAGNVVWTEDKAISGGRDTFKWNGFDDDGNKLDDGRYTLTVEATDAEGETVATAIEVSVVIDGVDFSGTEPVLLVGDEGIPLSQVTAVLGV
jgi:flagellar basal-body rod modification protein FlgD